MKLLLIEDDQALCAAMLSVLKDAGYTVDCAHDGESGLFYALDPIYGYDLAIIDRMLPIVDGLTIIKAMRAKQIDVPVLVITGLSAIEDRIEGLDGGADDYLVKPFHLQELLARVRALTRRPRTCPTKRPCQCADLLLDTSRRLLRCGDQSCTLTAKETALLDAFMRQPNEPFSKEQLIFKVWGSDAEIEPGNVDNYISFLRKRLRSVNSRCRIQTLYGKGYLLEAPHA